MYTTTDFDFDLPEDLIAQDPLDVRSNSRLMIYDTKRDEIIHSKFFNIADYLSDQDVLVVNKSKVIPARIEFVCEGANREVFILNRIDESTYRVLVRPGRFFPINKSFTIDENLVGTVIDIEDDGARIIKFDSEFDELDDYLESVGSVPLPPYIKGSKYRPDQYQAVYSEEKGSVAAPTAGLHFDLDLIDRIEDKGISFVKLLLHVGRGTFLPVKAENLSDHKMHEEEFFVSKENAEALNNAVLSDKRIIAVGTTSVRVLETNFRDDRFSEFHGFTDIFIYPGNYKWKVVDALVTNFHLPKSTLIMLVASFLEHKGVVDPLKKVKELYGAAIEKGYRFYSFGDAMFIF